MRILMLNYEYPPLGGGAANACKYILNELAKMSIEVDLVTSSPHKFEIEGIGDNIHIYKLPVRKKSIHYWTLREIISYSWKAKKQVDKLIAENHYNLCHAFFGIPCGAIAYLYKKKIPYIVSLRGSDVPGFNKRFSLFYIFLKPIIRKIWRKSRAIIANSEGLKLLAQKTDHDCKIGVIYNGIDTQQFRPVRPDNHTDKLRILCVSRLIKRKGIEYLLKSIPLVKEKAGKNFEVWIVGEGNLEEELKDLSSDLGLSDLVVFKGYVAHENLPEIYASSDLFVLPSFNEGMSNTILEAMASGLPIITTDTGGKRELINSNGVIIKEGNKQDIAEAIINLAGNPDKRKMMGQESKLMADSLSWEKVCEAYLKLYEN
jgi:L-malate glycosyltransferase